MRVVSESIIDLAMPAPTLRGWAGQVGSPLAATRGGQRMRTSSAPAFRGAISIIRALLTVTVFVMFQPTVAAATVGSLESVSTPTPCASTQGVSLFIVSLLPLIAALPLITTMFFDGDAFSDGGSFGDQSEGELGDDSDRFYCGHDEFDGQGEWGGGSSDTFSNHIPFADDDVELAPLRQFFHDHPRLRASDGYYDLSSFLEAQFSSAPEACFIFGLHCVRTKRFFEANIAATTLEIIVGGRKWRKDVFRRLSTAINILNSVAYNTHLDDWRQWWLRMLATPDPFTGRPLSDLLRIEDRKGGATVPDDVDTLTVDSFQPHNLCVQRPGAGSCEVVTAVPDQRTTPSPLTVRSIRRGGPSALPVADSQTVFDSQPNNLCSDCEDVQCDGARLHSDDRVDPIPEATLLAEALASLTTDTAQPPRFLGRRRQKEPSTTGRRGRRRF